MAPLRTFLLLSRGATLPTVWSHCVAGWWLGGGGHGALLPCVLVGATFLYLAGSFMDDAFDADYDAQHRRSRPIPSGYITELSVWRWSWTWVVLGLGSLFLAGRVTGTLGMVLSLWIILYGAIHRALNVSPVLLGGCRFFLYLIGASIGLRGVTGTAIWSGIALALYYVGTVCLLKPGARPAAIRYWPMLLFTAPLGLALLVNGGDYRKSALLLCAVLALWTIKNLRAVIWGTDAELGAATAGLHAGLVLVDWLASANAPRWLSMVFIALFFTAMLFLKVPPSAAPERLPATFR